MSALINKKGKQKRNSRQKTKAQLNKKHNKDFCEEKRKLLIAALKDKVHVMMVIACEHYMIIYYSNGKRVNRYGTFEKVCWLLSNKYFYQPRRGTLVNLYHFLEFKEENGRIWMHFPHEKPVKMSIKAAKNVEMVKEYVTSIQFLIARKNALK
jgi:hypothetical protein